MTHDPFPKWKADFLADMKADGYDESQLEWFATEFDGRTFGIRADFMAGLITENEALERQQGMFGQ